MAAPPSLFIPQKRNSKLTGMSKAKLQSIHWDNKTAASSENNASAAWVLYPETLLHSPLLPLGYNSMDIIFFTQK